MVSTNRSKLLDSFFYDSQTWGALHKAWKGYVIAKNKYEYDRMEYYASVIQKLQNELGQRVSSFHNIGLSALKFYSSRYSECLKNNNRNREEMITPKDDKGEYFEGDWNNGNRLFRFSGACSILVPRGILKQFKLREDVNLFLSPTEMVDEYKLFVGTL
jgi:hypothetical protein